MGVLNASWVGAKQYTHSYSNIYARWGDGAHVVSVGGWKSYALGTAALRKPSFVLPIGFVTSRIGGQIHVGHPDQYLRPQNSLAASWFGANSYVGSQYVVAGSWSINLAVYAASFQNSVVGEPALKLGQFFIDVGGIADKEVGLGYVLYPWQYAQPEWVLDASWVGAKLYHQPNEALDAAWQIPTPQTRIDVSVTGFGGALFGGASIYSTLTRVFIAGLKPPEIQPHTFKLAAQAFYPRGFDASLYGRADIYSGTRYVNVKALAVTTVFGRPWGSNWIQPVAPTGLPTKVLFGVARLPFKQYLHVGGLDATVVGAHSVSPQYIYVRGWENISEITAKHLVAFPIRYINVVSVAKVLEVSENVRVYSTLFTQRVVDASFYAALYGRASIENRVKTIYPDGLGPIRIPTHHLEEVEYRRFIYVLGMSTHLVPVHKIMQPYQFVGAYYLGDLNPSTSLGVQGAYGDILIELKTREIQASGIRPTLVLSSKAIVSDRAFYPETVTANKGEVWGRVDVSHEVRAIRNAGFLSQQLGRPRFFLEKHSIYAPFIYGFDAGVPYIDDGVRTLNISGLFPTEAVGNKLRVEFFVRAYSMQGWLSSRVSTYAEIKDARQFVGARSISSIEQGSAGLIQNYIRYIEPDPYRPSGIDPAEYGGAIFAERAIRVYVSPVNQWRFGVGVTIYIFKGDISEVGLRETLRFSTPMVAYRVRRCILGGFSSSHASTATIIRNAAFAIKTIGFGNRYVEQTHSVFNRNRAIRVLSLYDVEKEYIGRAFIADAVREVVGVTVRGASYIPQEHWVSNGVRYIATRAIYENTLTQRSEMEVFERFNRVRPYWNIQQRVQLGGPEVTLRNKRVSPYGYDQLLVGEGIYVGLYTREYVVGLGDQSLFGKLVIKDRRQAVRLQGIFLEVVSRFLAIRNLKADPPWARTVLVDPWEEKLLRQVGHPTVKDNVVNAKSVYGGSGFASPVVRTNTIAVDSGIVELTNWGDVHVAGPQYIGGVTLGTAPLSVVSKDAYLNPFHIFAAFGDMMPKGYHVFRENGVGSAKGGSGQAVDSGFGFGSSSAPRDKNDIWWIPRPTVEHRHRTLVGRGLAPPWPVAGHPRPHTVDYAVPPKVTRYIRASTVGGFRSGWHVFGPSTQYIEVQGLKSKVFFGGSMLFYSGEYTEWLLPRSIAASSLGANIVTYSTRPLLAKWYASSVFASPRCWFAKRYLNAKGGVSTSIVGAKAWVSNKTRYVEVPGFDALDPEEAFIGRPTTIRNVLEGVVVAPLSIESSAFFGIGVVDFRVKYVRPRGVFPFPANRVRVKSRLALSAQGFETIQFGDVRKFEEGAIQVHETASGVVSMPMVSTPRQVQGFVSSMVDYPIIAAHIGPQSIASEGSGATVLKNEICCGDCG